VKFSKTVNEACKLIECGLVYIARICRIHPKYEEESFELMEQCYFMA
jgi:hypothetical protein